MLQKFSDISSVNQFLERIPKFQDTGRRAARMGLDNITRFCALIGNPQDKYGIIHVAGTNGKGTVCHMLANGYAKAGYKTGLYTSPHLIHFRERIKINGADIPDTGILRFFQTFEAPVCSSSLTYFELTTALAFWWFSDQKVDIAVIETGLGGRLDATNIVKPAVSIITSVGMDHQEFLGNTIKDIAREKAGIIKPHIPVVTGRLNDEAMQVVSEYARQVESPVYMAGDMNPGYSNGKFYLNEGGERIYLETDLAGSIQAINLAMCRKAMILNKKYPVGQAHFRLAAAHAGNDTGLKARFECIRDGRLWFFDGAHNPESLRILKQTISELNTRLIPVLVISLMRDKLKESFIKEFSEFKKIHYYRIQSERAATFEEVRAFLPQADLLTGSWEEIQSFFRKHRSDLVIFTGSFYFYKTVMNWITNYA